MILFTERAYSSNKEHELTFIAHISVITFLSKGQRQIRLDLAPHIDWDRGNTNTNFTIDEINAKSLISNYYTAPREQTWPF